MRKSKQAKLERAGWKIGSVSDFLGLSAAEEAIVELRVPFSRKRPSHALSPIFRKPKGRSSSAKAVTHEKSVVIKRKSE